MDVLRLLYEAKPDALMEDAAYLEALDAVCKAEHAMLFTHLVIRKQLQLSNRRSSICLRIRLTMSSLRGSGGECGWRRRGCGKNKCAVNVYQTL